MHKQHPTTQSNYTRGFTLIEVLIALVIFSIGLLGLAGMQIQGLKYNHDSYLRSQATILAYDLLDRMRANPSLAASYVMDDTAITTTPTNCTSGSGCDGAQLVAFDQYEWKTAITSTLPNGKGKVDVTPGTTPAVYVITVTWDTSERRDKKATEAVVDAATFTLRTVL